MNIDYANELISINYIDIRGGMNITRNRNVTTILMRCFIEWTLHHRVKLYRENKYKQILSSGICK